VKIAFDSELMENQKHAVVMAPDLAFEVLQAQEGDSLFFSIGTDHVFYVTREATQSSTGWTRVDLSSALAAQHGGAAVAATAFAVAQNARTRAIDLAVVVSVGGTDFLYLSQGNAGTDAAWASGVTWTAVPFDAGTAPSPLQVADVYLMNVPADGGAAENLFVDVVRTPGDALALLDRYYIVPGGSPQWQPHRLAADLAAGSIASCLGQRANDPVPGIYTFGTIGGEQELVFTPQYNYFRPTLPPNPARLGVPAGASAIASALDADGVSNLFVAGAGGLYLFTPGNQHDGATPVQVVAGGIVAGARELAAATAGGRTAVWGVDPQGKLFYAACPAGSEASAAAWSPPVPLLPSVDGFAFFLNPGAGNSVLFAHVSGQELVQLTQDPATGEWTQRSILLPSTATGDVAVFHTFTSHLTVTGDGGFGVPNAAVAVTATTAASVYINDVYYRLSPTVAVNATTDEAGVLTVVQETQSLAAVCFRVALAGAPEVVAEVNPMQNALATLATVKTGADLAGVQVTNADGTRQPLVPSSVSADDTDAVARSVAQFVKINAGLPQDGSPRAAGSGSAAAPAAPAARSAPAAALAVPRTWGVSFADGGVAYHEGDDAVRRFGATAAFATPTLAGGAMADADAGSAIRMAAGDFFRWVKDAFDDVEHFVVQEAEGAYHFLARIGNAVYDVLLDTVAAVVHAVEFVFNRIEVFFEDLIKWLGFLFEWGDILRTHAVLKNLFSRYLAKCVGELGGARGQLQSAFTQVEHFIDGWAGIADHVPASLGGATLNGTAAANPPVRGLNTPQSNWGVYHLKHNAANGSTTARPNAGVLGDVAAVLQPLADALDREREVFQAALDSFRSEVIDRIQELSLAQVLKAVVAIIADALLESVENVLLAAVDVLAALVGGVMDALNATIEIPVLSWLYRKVTGDDLSLLDATCLVAAIPVTLCHKLVAGAAPFPDDATTAALIRAPDFAAIQRICNGRPAAPARFAAPAARAAAPAAPVALAAPAVPVVMAAAPRAAAAAAIPDAVNRALVLGSGIMSAVGSVVVSVFGPLKQKYPEIKVFSVLNGLAYLYYVAPDIVGQIPDLQDRKWWAITNQAVADVMTVKAMVDMGVGLTATDSKAQTAWNPLSPWVDFVGNIVWQVPTTAALFDAENQNTAGILEYFGGTCFDGNGVLSPALAVDQDPKSWAVLVALATTLNLAYGALSCAGSVLAFEG